MAERALRQRGDGALGRLVVDANGPALAVDPDALFTQQCRGRADQIERVGLAKTRLVTAGLDPRRQPELVQELDHLRGGRFDHLDVTRGRLLEVLGADQRLREAADGRERGPQIVRGEGDELRKAGVFGHFGTVASR